MTILNIIFDLSKLILHAVKGVFVKKDKTWTDWYMEYIPVHISDFGVLACISLLSVCGLSEEFVTEHKQNNEIAWENYRASHDSLYIEKQSELKDFQYGREFTVNYNGCEVIAVYNALQYLRLNAKEEKMNEPEWDFPSLLSEFEKKGITKKGAYGTSPMAVKSFFKKCNRKTDTIKGRNATNEKISHLEKEYSVFIMTVFNNKNNLKDMVHTMCITKEENVFTIHNDYEGTRSYPSLAEAIQGYKNGNARLICITGITSECL